jgi:RNA polymerase-binding transcription factor DksA
MAASTAPAASNGMGLDRVETFLVERLAALQNALRALEPMEAADPVELASGLPSDDVDFSCMESISREIGEINEALARVREGRYGLCEGCGKAIAPARLEAIPYARLCLACKKAEEER